jgi:phospholipid/cholesterol/gamma-HCH transport system substrate-binding protein
MNSNSSQKIKTGIFVIAGLGFLLLLIILIGNQKNLFRSTIKLHINYSNVAGLQEGAFVRFAGINVGSVDMIDIINDSTVRVDISIQKRIKKFIRTDSKASIASDGLMGDKLIQLVPGSDDAQVIAENGELVAVNPLDMDKLMSKVGKVGDRVESIVNNIDTLSGNLASIFGKVNSGHGTLGKLINNEKLADDLQQTVTDAKKTVNNANKAATGLNEDLDAAKHNFLLRGFFKKKEKKRIADSIAHAKAIQKNKDASKDPKKN